MAETSSPEKGWEGGITEMALLRKKSPEKRENREGLLQGYEAMIESQGGKKYDCGE